MTLFVISSELNQPYIFDRRIMHLDTVLPAYDDRCAIDDRKLDAELDWKSTEVFETGICDVLVISATQDKPRFQQFLDTDAHGSLLEAVQFVTTREKHQGLKIACVEEIAWRNGVISSEKFGTLSKPLVNSGYGQ